MTDRNVILATIVGLVAEQKRNAEALADRIRKAQKERGLALDTRADYAEGSAAAYSMTLSIIAGAAGVADPMQLAETGDAPVSDAELGPVGDAIESRMVGGVLIDWPIDHADGE